MPQSLPFFLFPELIFLLLQHAYPLLGFMPRFLVIPRAHSSQFYLSEIEFVCYLIEFLSRQG